MAMSKGCTIALVVFAIFILLIIILGIVLWMNKDKLVDVWLDTTINMVEKEITANIPPGYTPESIHQIFSAFKAGVKNKEIDAQEGQRLAKTFQDAMQDKKIDADEGTRLLQMIIEALPPGTIPADTTAPVEPPVDSLQVVPDSV